MASGIFLAALDQTVVVTALPSIMQDIHIPVTELDRAAWIVTGYLLGYTVAMPLIGRVADVYGHARLYLLSTGVFMAGSVLVALAPDLSWLVTARIFQAVGGGAVVPIAMAMTADVFPPHRRGVALGIIGAAAEAGGVLGPFWGGVIVQQLDWRWIFWINVPLGLAIATMVLLFNLPRDRRGGRVDYRGGLLLAGALTCLTLALSGTMPGPYDLPPALLLYPAAVAFGLAFLYCETRVSEPLIRLGLFRSLTFSSANLTHLLLGGALIIAMVNIPLMTDTVMGREPIEGGLRLMRLTAMIPVGALAGGFLCQRVGYALPASLGFLLAALGFYLMSGWPMDIGEPGMTLHLLVAGLGFGLVIAPVATAVLNSVEEEFRAAAALLTVMRMAGMLVGLAALSAWGMGRFFALTAGLPGLLEPDYSPELAAASMTLFREFFLVSMALCLVALLPALGMRRR